MRIINGRYKNRRFNIPKNLKIRPTTDKAKESLFNILENMVNFNEIKTLDLFSGSGNISYEFFQEDQQLLALIVILNVLSLFMMLVRIMEWIFQ